MKRSSVVEELAKFLKKIGMVENYPNAHLDDADEIITFLENKGMKPPLKKKCPVLFTDIFTWEKE
jgi:hypothetical protein